MMLNSNLRKLYTEKQIEVMKSAISFDCFIYVLHGAKRSGKTIVNNDLLLLELQRVREQADKDGVDNPQYILAGNSLGSLQKNVLNEITNKYGIEFKFDQYNRFKLLGVTVCCFGHGSVRDMARIRGMTSYGAYINEGSTAIEEVYKEIIDRCSGEGARIFVDTNPDHPEHWLKKDYIDKADNKKITEFSFILDDNTFLSPRYVENIKATTPSGMFYERNILGKWVSAEGVIYADFDASKMVIPIVDRKHLVKVIAGVDWGYSHYGSIVVIGIDGVGNHILLEEHAHQFKEIDFWAETALDIKSRYGNIPFYCDGARPEHVARFIRENILAFYADKNVSSGIEAVAGLIKSNKFYVVSNEENRPERFMHEIYNYIWNSDKDEPVKANDDVLDSIRYAIYSNTKLNITYDYAGGKDWGNYND